MSPKSMSTVLRYLRDLVSGTESEGESDQNLLQRYVSQRDERAFALLLGRHGPMTMAVCLRILGDQHSAEDAFQATFLVLASRPAPFVNAAPWPAGSMVSPVGWLISSRPRRHLPDGGDTSPCATATRNNHGY